MGVTHDHHPQLRLPGQQLSGPGALLGRGGLESRLVPDVVAQSRAEALDQPESQVRVQRALPRRCDRMVDDSVEQDGTPAWLGEAVAMNRGDTETTQVECQPVGIEPDAEVPAPEIAAPAIVVSPYH